MLPLHVSSLCCWLELLAPGALVLLGSVSGKSWQTVPVHGGEDTDCRVLKNSKVDGDVE